jgi:hypothetical protein
MPPFLDPDSLNDLALAGVKPVSATAAAMSASASVPILVLSPSSLSHRPEVLESLLSSLPSSQPHDLHMLDRIALNFANLPGGYYKDAVLALPSSEETSGEVEKDYAELRNVFGKLLEAMQPGGRLKIGSPSEQLTKDAVLSGFLIETENNQVLPPLPSALPAFLSNLF